MRFFSWINKQLLKLKSWNWGLIAGLIGIFIGALSLWIAYQALVVTKNSIEEANKQRGEDNIRGDFLYYQKLKVEENLNDSLIKQIEDLQLITSHQLEVSSKQSEVIKKQLNILEATLDEQEYAGRPKMAFIPSTILDTVFKDNDNYFSPTIATGYRNVGRRFAYNVIFRCFVVYDQFRLIRPDILIDNSRIENIEPEGYMSYLFNPNISSHFKEDFYYCYEITYFDKRINKTFKQASYSHYYKRRGAPTFYSCTEEEVGKIRAVINNKLKVLNKPPFDL